MRSLISIPTPDSISVIQGRKGPQDGMVLYRGQPITLLEHLALGVLLVQNEDRIYPQFLGYLGGNLYTSLLLECLRKRDITPELCHKYKMKWE